GLFSSLRECGDEWGEVGGIDVRDGGELQPATTPADDVESARLELALLRRRVGPRPREQVDDVAPTLEHDGRDLAPARVIEASSDEREAAIREIPDLGREIDARCEPWLDTVLIRRLHIGEVIAHE